MNNIALIVEDGYNTSYIDSLLIALFYKNSHICNILNKILIENNRFMYLQDIITNVIENIRRNYSVDSSFMNEIRNFSFMCGWKYGLTLQNTVEYYDFLSKGFECDGIECEIYSTNSGITRTLKTNYIELTIDHDSDTKNLLNIWIKQNLILDKNSMYHFKKLPVIVAMYMNRNIDNIYSVDLKKKIKFYGNNNPKQLEATWIIHSIICYTTSNNGKYYSILPNDNGWFIFGNDKIPSFNKLDMSFDDIMKKKIMQECVLVFYRLDDKLC